MDENETRQLINRILSGYTFVGKYILDIPSAEILSEADYIYQNFLYENRFEKILPEDRTKILLMKHGLWNLAQDNTFEEIPKKLDNAKLNLFHNAIIPSKVKRLRTHIESLRREYNILSNKRSLFDEYTLEYLAETERERFIFSNTILNKEYKRIDIRPILLDRIILESKKIAISVNKYRELARSDAWSNIWAATKTASFRKIGIEQRHLISYTSLYNNINKHPECPNQIVINDDDMLDGWLIHIKEKQDREKREQDFEKSSKVTAKGNEHFIMTSNSAEDIQSVLDMNDTRGKIIQKKIHSMAKTEGVANEYNIQEIRQDANIIQR